MKVSCKRAQLVAGIQTVQSIVAARSTLPVLSNILVEAEGNTLRLAATDLEMAIRCDVPADVSESGGITLPAKRLGDMIRELPEDSVEISVKKEEPAVIRCRKVMFRIAGLSTDSFPKLPGAEGGAAFDIEQGRLKELLRRTAFAVSRDQTRQVLNGVYFGVKGGSLTVVATDGRRLSKVTRQLAAAGNAEREMIVPGKAVGELLRILKDGDERACVRIGENQAAFELDGIVFISRLLEGRFPNYEQVIPKKGQRRMSVSLEELLAGVRRVALMASERSNSIRLELSEKTLTLSAATPEVGEAREEIDIDYQGEPVAIAFNPNYLTDFLRSEQAAEVIMEITDGVSPGVLKPVGDDTYVHVVMPIKL